MASLRGQAFLDFHCMFYRVLFVDGKKAVGTDGITKEEYGARLEENLEELEEKLKKKAYKPKPAKRVEIPKENGKTRPLSIYCYEAFMIGCIFSLNHHTST